MSGQNVLPLDPHRRVPSAVLPDATRAMLIFVIYEALMFAGMVIAFLLTRATAGGAWPPAGQPWFSLAETATNSAALLASGALVFLAAGAWERREARSGHLLLAAIVLGACFVVFQGIAWASVLRQGLTLTSSEHGNFLCLIVGMHSAHVRSGLKRSERMAWPRATCSPKAICVAMQRCDLHQAVPAGFGVDAGLAETGREARRENRDRAARQGFENAPVDGGRPSAAVGKQKEIDRAEKPLQRHRVEFVQSPVARRMPGKRP